MEPLTKIKGVKIDPINDFKISWVKNGVASKDFVDFADEFGDILANLHLNKKNKELTMKTNIKDYEKKNFKDESLTKSQIRNFYSSIKTLEMKGKHFDKKDVQAKLFMLKPLLEYAYKRNSSIAFGYFKSIVIKMLDEIYSAEEKVRKEYFKNFCMIIEAILAYHRAHGGN
ncbi:type III-A CRISPR-associated protein Csm2 [Calditrichota bacterium GD2]